MADEKQNGWNEYSKLVLKELSTLGDAIESLRSEMQHIKQELVREDKVDELKVWKEKIDDICSPSQLKDTLDEIESLKTFKTKAITIFAAAQIAMGFFAWALKSLG